MSQSRQLAAIMFTDIVGYTALMQENEEKAVALIKHYNAALNETVSLHEGKVLNYYGDGSLCTFPSATEAINCAMDLQKKLQSDPVVPLRIGLHIGEVFFEDGKALGDGVNVASRIQSLGQANTILFSKEIYDKVKNHPEFKAVSLGQFDFKNVDEAIEVFALANEGLFVPQRKKMEGKLQQKNVQKRNVIVALSLIVLAAIAFFVWKKIDSENQTATIDSIAVLPFENAGANKDLEYMSDGITESLINYIYNVTSLRVITRSTVFQFKGKDAQAQKIGKELGVKAVLTGRIISRGDSLNIQVELVDIQKQAQLWGEQYNRSMTDFLAVQQEIAGTISEKLRLRLSGTEKKNLLRQYTENNEAYQLYLKGNYFIQKATPGELAKGYDLLNQAIKLDPNFPLPYIGIAYYYFVMTDYYLAPAIAMPELKKAADRALQIDEELAQARALSGWYDLWYAWNWNGAKEQFRTAIDLSPNEYLPHFFYSWYLSAWGRFDESIEEGKRFAELQPLSPEGYTFYGLMLYYAGKYDDAIAQFQKALDLDPNYPIDYLYLGFCDIQKGNLAKAVAEYQRAHALLNSPWSLARLGYAYAKAGNRQEAMSILDSLEQQAKRMYVASDIVATIHVALGDHDRAFEYLQKGYEERAGSMIWLRVDPVWNPLRSDQRFIAILNKMGLTQ
jgi:adenylate cyclase